MIGDNDNLQSALKALADESRGAQASARVRDALRVELRSRNRRYLAAWWPAAAAAALILGIWLGVPRKAVQPQPPVVAVAEPEPAPRPAEVGTDREVSQPAPTPAVTRATAAYARPPRVRPAPEPVEEQPVSGTVRPLTPWYFYTGLPVSTRGQVVRIRVSNETAAQFGIVAESNAIPAQVFIGDDGVARAIRFIR
ncbi:hypothetical protein [uncultured Paludibaculum sp.]|uniref:hypothetical protein n=1 Tax=uncultured Paludibaculum sp. TaxID=1765020 RepID=UPI002AAA9448|nr:hypothetical protein [uncultured Paludibaculum sp.]